MTALAQNLAVASANRSRSTTVLGDLKLRVEALGVAGVAGNTSKLEQRLLEAVSDLKLAEDERKASTALSNSRKRSCRYQKSCRDDRRQKRASSLEAASRHERHGPSGDYHRRIVERPAVPSTLTDGMVISIKEDLALVVANVGRTHGVKVGMPFQVLRGDQLIGTVRVVDVREKIAGAVIQNLKSEKGRIKSGDRL